MPTFSFKILATLLSSGTKTVDRALHRSSKKLRTKSKTRIVPTKSQKQLKEPPKLSDDIWGTICDHLSPFDQIKLRRVNKQLNNVIEKRLHSQIYLDIVKCDMNDILPDGAENDGMFHEFNYQCNNNCFVHLRKTFTNKFLDFCFLLEIGFDRL